MQYAFCPTAHSPCRAAPPPPAGATLRALRPAQRRNASGTLPTCTTSRSSTTQVQVLWLCTASGRGIAAARTALSACTTRLHMHRAWGYYLVGSAQQPVWVMPKPLAQLGAGRHILDPLLPGWESKAVQCTDDLHYRSASRVQSGKVVVGPQDDGKGEAGGRASSRKAGRRTGRQACGWADGRAAGRRAGWQTDGWAAGRQVGGQQAGGRVGRQLGRRAGWAGLQAGWRPGMQAGSRHAGGDGKNRQGGRGGQDGQDRHGGRGEWAGQGPDRPHRRVGSQAGW